MMEYGPCKMCMIAMRIIRKMLPFGNGNHVDERFWKMFLLSRVEPRLDEEEKKEKIRFFFRVCF